MGSQRLRSAAMKLTPKVDNEDKEKGDIIWRTDRSEVVSSDSLDRLLPDWLR